MCFKEYTFYFHPPKERELYFQWRDPSTELYFFKIMRYCEGKIHYGSAHDLLDMRVLVCNFDEVINTIDNICK